jgi:hypothetical protein
MESVVLASTSPVWAWVMALLQNILRRDAAVARTEQRGALDIHRLTMDEVRILGSVAARARGEN